MSTVKAVNLQHPNSSNINMVLGADGSVSGGLPSPNRNLIYNGAMQVHQRGTSTASISTSGYYTADRWNFAHASAGTWTQSIENDAPTGSGFRKSVKMLCTTAKASLGSGDLALFLQRLEGQDLQRLNKGNASAQQITASFWVKSNVTGTYILDIYDPTNSRGISASYTINTSGIWEKKVITFAGDTSGVLNNDTAESLNLRYWLAGGSSHQSGSLQTSWATSSSSVAVGQTNLAATVNNYWQITGVQLESGPAPTPFEFKSYAQELRECQRYYYRTVAGPVGSATGSSAMFTMGYAYSTTAALTWTKLPVRMRARPSTLDYSNVYAYTAALGAITMFTLGVNTDWGNEDTVCVFFTTGSLTSGSAYMIGARSDLGNGYLGFSAEL